jgi:hypothetical protein
MEMVNETLKGFILVVIFVSLLAFPLLLWLPPEIALAYCRQSLAAIGWLWILVAPLVAVTVWAIEQYRHILRHQ